MADEQAELARLRSEIDRVDRSMHELLMERGRMISALQAAKGVGAAKGSGAMRPAREARMMRAIQNRHQGPFPLGAVERIWREIIAAFTQLQAQFEVYAAGSDQAALAESASFYFGVSSPVHYLATAEEVLTKVQNDIHAVGFLLEPVAQISKMPWWTNLALTENRNARIVAHYPFLTGDGDASWIVSQAPFEPSGDDCTLLVLRDENDVAAFGCDATELDRASVDGKLLILTGIDGYFTSEDIVARSGAETKYEYLGGYARISEGRD